MRTLLATILTLAVLAPVASAQINPHDDCPTGVYNTSGDMVAGVCHRSYETDSDPNNPGGDWCTHSETYIKAGGREYTVSQGVDPNRPGQDDCGSESGATCYAGLVYYDNDPPRVGGCSLLTGLDLGGEDGVKLPGGGSNYIERLLADPPGEVSWEQLVPDTSSLV
jgi:hypothetical protein